jgi:FtsP/CotA-like multicopper oxidase with cupredoxin domain
VAARRLILAMLVLLVLSSIAAALIPLDRSHLSDSTTSTTTTPAAPQGTLITKRISTTARTGPTIHMKVGDELRLTVTSPVPNMVEIPAFGELEDVDPDLAAQFDLLAFDSGSFAIRLVDPPGLVGRIDVAPGD